MEMTNLSTETQNDKRSNIKTCIIESWKVFALHTQHYFKYLWFHLLMAGIGFAIFSAEATYFFTEYVQPTQTLIGEGYDATLAKSIFSPSASAYAALVISILAFALSTCLMYGAVFSHIRFYKATDSLPLAGPFTFWREIKKDAIKTFTIDFIYILALAIFTAIITTISYFTNWWVMLAELPVFIYWLVICTTGRQQHVVEKKPLKVALKEAFTFGHKHFGGYLILILLTSIPMLLIAYAALLPSSVVQLSISADMISRLIGDPSGIPPYVIPLYMVISTVGFFIFSLAYSLQQWPLALYTSAVTKNKK